MIDTKALLLWSAIGFGLSVVIETPILVFGLSKHYSLREKLFAGVWLTACSYPIVAWVIPSVINPVEHKILYLLVAETFAPLVECALFWTAFGTREEFLQPSFYRDMVAIIMANLCSFALGELLNYLNVL